MRVCAMSFILLQLITTYFPVVEVLLSNLRDQHVGRLATQRPKERDMLAHLVAVLLSHLATIRKASWSHVSQSRGHNTRFKRLRALLQPCCAILMRIQSTSDHAVRIQGKLPPRWQFLPLSYFTTAEPGRYPFLIMIAQ